MVLTIEKDNTIKLNQEIVPIERLRSRLRDFYLQQTRKQIFVRADSTVPYKDVLRVLDLVSGSGVEVLGVTTDRYSTAAIQK